MKVFRSDITDEMAIKANVRINEALDKHQIEKDIAGYIKKRSDEDFGGTWHCIAGRNFGCSITHDTLFIYFVQVEQIHVLLFKSFE